MAELTEDEAIVQITMPGAQLWLTMKGENSSNSMRRRQSVVGTPQS